MQTRKGLSSRPWEESTCFSIVLLLPAYWLFFAGSLFAGSLAEPEVEPLPDGWSVDEAGGVALLLLEPDGLDGVLVEPEAEPLLEGDDGDVERVGLDDDVPVAPVPLEPRSQPARAAPNATDTATARIESFMLPP
jgi:hypothetical protein